MHEPFGFVATDWRCRGSKPIEVKPPK